MKRFALMIAAGAVAVAAGGLVATSGQAQSGAAVGVALQGDFGIARSRARTPDEAVYLIKCQYCHVEMGAGTVTLARRVGEKQAKLADRTDLTADYVKAIVRNGINTMPAINRAEVNDAELEQIARYLSNPKPAAKSPPRKPSK